MKRKLFSTILCVVLTLALVACGGKEPVVTPDGSASGTAVNAGAPNKEYTAEMLTRAIPTDNVQVSIEGLGLKVSMSNGYACFETNITDDETGKQVTAATYIIKNDMYMKASNPESGESSYMHAKFEDDTISTAKEGTSIASPEEFGVSENAIVDYVDTVVEDGVTFDIVHVTSEDTEQVGESTVTINGIEQNTNGTVYTSEADYYINVDTGLVERVITYSPDTTENSKTIVTFKVIDSIVLPEEFSTPEVQELSSTDMSMVFFMQMSMMFSGDMEGTANEGITSNTYTQDKVYNPATLNSTLPTDNIQFCINEIGYALSMTNGHLYIEEVNAFTVADATDWSSNQVYCTGSDVYCRMYISNLDKYIQYKHTTADYDVLEYVASVCLYQFRAQDTDNVEYLETIEEEGTKLDVVDCTDTDGAKRTYYINVDTGLVDKIVLHNRVDNIETITVAFSDANEVLLPAEFSTAKVREVPLDDIYIPAEPFNPFTDSLLVEVPGYKGFHDMESGEEPSDEVTHFYAH